MKPLKSLLVAQYDHQHPNGDETNKALASEFSSNADNASNNIHREEWDSSAKEHLKDNSESKKAQRNACKLFDPSSGCL
jgi:hypothetical protein